MASTNDPFSCDDVVLYAADLGHQYGGPVGGVAAAAVTADAMATPAGEAAIAASTPATGSQLATAGLALSGAYHEGHALGEHYAAPLAADLAYVGCLPVEIGGNVGHDIGTGLHNFFSEPSPSHHSWSPDLAGAAPANAAPNVFDGPAWGGHAPAAFQGALGDGHGVFDAPAWGGAGHNAFDPPAWGGEHSHNAFDGPAWGGHAGDVLAHASFHDSGASGHDGSGGHSDHGGGGHSMGEI